MTPNAAPALFDLLKKLPGVIGNSLSGDGIALRQRRPPWPTCNGG